MEQTLGSAVRHVPQGARHRASDASSIGHALRSAAVPIVTVVGIQVGVLLGGAIVVEIAVRAARRRPDARHRHQPAQLPRGAGGRPGRGDAVHPASTCSPTCCMRGSTRASPRPTRDRHDQPSERPRARPAPHPVVLTRPPGVPVAARRSSGSCCWASWSLIAVRRRCSRRTTRKRSRRPRCMGHPRPRPPVRLRRARPGCPEPGRSTRSGSSLLGGDRVGRAGVADRRAHRARGGLSRAGGPTRC